MKIITFLWAKHDVKPPSVVKYGAEHVNILQAMLARHLRMSHELICITDMPAGVACRTLPLWDKFKSSGGCFNRLYMYHPDMRHFIGPRFACIDLDVVLTGNVDHVFNREEPILIHEYRWKKPSPGQRYNGSLVMMDAGCHTEVYDKFDPRKSPRILARDRTRVGSDQAWVDYCLPDIPTLGERDGIYEAATIGDKLPADACMVFFSGRQDPSQRSHEWVRRHYY